MNKLIQELSLQAGIAANLSADVVERDKNKWIDLYSEKFAQLIVKECLTICQYNADDDDDQFDLGRVHQAKEITHLIKKHFGIEP
jgi:hypothetical protein